MKKKNNVTFRDLYDNIQMGNVKGLRIYSNQLQVNILDDNDLSSLNIFFLPLSNEVNVYLCPIPGHCNYFDKSSYTLDTPLKCAIPKMQYNTIVNAIA